MKTLIERLEADIAFAGRGPVVVRARDLRALIAAHKEATAKAEGMEEVVVAKMAERDAAEAKLKALREAAVAMLAALAKNGRPCGACYAIATWAEPLPCGGSAYRCDQHHKHDDPDEDGLSPSETEVAAPLRALRAALKEEP